MSLDFQLSPEQVEILENTMKEDETYIKLRDRMRAAVIFASQSMAKGTEQGDLSQFNKQLPDIPDIDISLGIIEDFLQKRGFNHTLSVFSEEVRAEMVEQGREKAAAIIGENEENMDLLSSMVSKATD